MSWRLRPHYDRTGNYAFRVYPGDADKLYMDFEGGGACFNEFTTTNTMLCKSRIAQHPTKGIYDKEEKRNPFRLGREPGAARAGRQPCKAVVARRSGAPLILVSFRRCATVSGSSTADAPLRNRSFEFRAGQGLEPMGTRGVTPGLGEVRSSACQTSAKSAELGATSTCAGPSSVARFRPPNLAYVGHICAGSVRIPPKICLRLVEPSGEFVAVTSKACQRCAADLILSAWHGGGRSRPLGLVGCGAATSAAGVASKDQGGHSRLRGADDVYLANRGRGRGQLARRGHRQSRLAPAVAIGLPLRAWLQRAGLVGRPHDATSLSRVGAESGDPAESATPTESRADSDVDDEAPGCCLGRASRRLRGFRHAL